MNSVELIVAGYVLLVPTPRPASQGYAVLPETFLTISDCLMADLPRPEFWDWYVDRQEAERDRMSRAPHAETITVAMAPGDALNLMQEHGGTEQPYFDLLRTQSRLPAESQILGYEVVGADWALDFHSWHCHGYAAEAVEGLRVQLNEVGMLDSYHEAARVLTWMLSRPVEDQPAPVDWMVVAIARP